MTQTHQYLFKQFLQRRTQDLTKQLKVRIQVTELCFPLLNYCHFNRKR